MFALRQNLRQFINSKALKNIKAVNNTRYHGCPIYCVQFYRDIYYAKYYGKGGGGNGQPGKKMKLGVREKN